MPRLPLLALALTLVASPALAADWSRKARCAGMQTAAINFYMHRGAAKAANAARLRGVSFAQAGMAKARAEGSADPRATIKPDLQAGRDEGRRLLARGGDRPGSPWTQAQAACGAVG